MQVPSPWPCPGTSDTACRWEEKMKIYFLFPSAARKVIPDACTTNCASECKPWRFNDSLIPDRDPANIKRLSSKTNVWPPTSWSQHTRVVIFSHAEPFPRRDNVDDFQLSCLSVWPTRVNLVSIAENYLKYLSSSLSPSILYGKLKLGKTLN